MKLGANQGTYPACIDINPDQEVGEYMVDTDKLENWIAVHSSGFEERWLVCVGGGEFAVGFVFGIQCNSGDSVK